MVTLKIENYSSSNLTEETTLNADALASQAAITVVSNQNIATDDYVLIGNIGGDRTELKKVLSITGVTTITATANLSNPHSRYEKVTKLFGNKIRIYRASNVDGTQPDDGDFSLLDTIDIDPDQTESEYTDDSGSSDYWYKYTYYNSTSTDETSRSDSRVVRGGNTANYCSISRIRGEAGLTSNVYVTDGRIDEKRQAAQGEINGALTGLYTLPFTEPVPATIEDLTARLAAGLLLTSPWAGRFVSTSSEGNDKLKQARADLLAIKEKQQSIVDANGNSTAIANVGGFQMYPDADTENLDFTDGGAGFKVADRY